MKNLILVLISIISIIKLDAQTELDSLKFFLNENKKSENYRFAPNLFKKAEIAFIELEKEKPSLNKKGYDKKLNNINRLFKEAKKTSILLKPTLEKLIVTRDKAEQFNFLRNISPEFFFEADKSYERALILGEKGLIDDAKVEVKNAVNKYNTAVKKISELISIQELNTGLKEKIQEAEESLKLLQAFEDGGINIKDAGKIAPLLRRQLPSNLTPNNTGLINENDLYPPTPPFPIEIPKPATSFMFYERQTNSLSFRWYDGSANEDGNRIIRQTSIYERPDTIRELGILNLLSKNEYTDNNLIPDKRYSYKLDTYNKNGFSHTPFIHLYTKDTFDFPVWRVQLVVKTANKLNAGTDSKIQVSLFGWNTLLLSMNQGTNLTTLDYGRNDFKEGTIDTFDLNFIGDIDRLGDIEQIYIKSDGSERDHYLNNSTPDYFEIEEVKLLVNGITVFSKNYNSIGGLQLIGKDENIIATHFELRNSTLWSDYKKGFQTPNYPFLGPLLLGQYKFGDRDGKCSIVIKNKEIIDRLEGFIGHSISTVKELYWGEKHGKEYVESEYVDSSTIKIDLDFKAEIPYRNPEVDIDFDVKISAKCENDTFKVVFKINNLNVTADYDFWDYTFSLGALAAVEKIANKILACEYSNFSEEFKIPIPFADFGISSNIICDIKSCPSPPKFDKDGNLIIFLE